MGVYHSLVLYWFHCWLFLYQIDCRVGWKSVCDHFVRDDKLDRVRVKHSLEIRRCFLDENYRVCQMNLDT